MTTFNDLNLHPQLVQAVTELGYKEPTPIQEAVIPLLLEGQDIIGQAQTGTGKTAAFALPILHQIEPNAGHVQALVVAPTRELALQVSNAMYEFGQHRGVRVLTVYGGQPYGRQVSRIRRGVDVIVGTPGRMLDLIKQKILDLSQVAHVALDEADEMLSMGFIEDIEAILSETPTNRQTALFSATMPNPIRQLSQKYMRDPQEITIARKALTVSTVEQRYYMVNESDKLAVLTRLFEVEEMGRAIVFVRTRADAGHIANELSTRGYGGEALSGDLSQDARTRVLQRFRDEQIAVLVATDVAARGLDIDDVSHVFNFNLPPDPEVYVHRIGRTGRVGKAGKAYSLVTPKQTRRLQRIQSYTKHKITKATIPTVEEIQDYRDTKMLQSMEVWLKRGRCSREKEMISKLVEEGHDLFELAAVSLKVARSAEKQRPIAKIGVVKEVAESNRNRRRGDSPSRMRYGKKRDDGRKRKSKAGGKRSHEAGMVRLSINAGKEQGLRPNDVVGTIAYHADIPGRSIGAISIQEGQTYVDVPEQYVEKVLNKVGQYRVHRQNLVIEKA